MLLPSGAESLPCASAAGKGRTSTDGEPETQKLDEPGHRCLRQPHRLPAVSAREVDEYLSTVKEPKRDALESLRTTILATLPDAEQVISYRVPAFRIHGETVAGFAAFRDHLSYLPFSGSVLEQLADELDGYTMTKSSLHFTPEHPLPETLVKRLIEVRLATTGRSSR